MIFLVHYILSIANTINTMRESYTMPSSYDTGPTEYAGKEPTFEKKSVAQRDTGERVVIVDYDKDNGLYVVMDSKSSTIYKIHPDKLSEVVQDS